MATEGLGHRGDKADFTGRAIGKAVFARRLAALVGYLHERPAGMDALVDVRGGHDKAARPVAVGIERHKFDKAHDDAGFAGVQSKGFYFVVVQAADQDGVHLGGRQARFLGDIDTVHHGGKGLGSGDAFEFGGIERIEADIDAAETGGQEPVAPFGKQVAVGGHGEVLDAEGMEARDVVLDAFADERLAAGDADFTDAQAEKNPSKTVELGPGENFVVFAVVFRVSGAAVNAAEIAAVRDGDAQVGDLAAEFVVKGHGPLCLLDAAPSYVGALEI